MTQPRTCTVRQHTRKRPYADEYAKTTAKLLAEVEAYVDRQITAAFRTFPINARRALRGLSKGA